MKMSTPTSLWCYCSYVMKWNVGKVYSALDSAKIVTNPADRNNFHRESVLVVVSVVVHIMRDQLLR